MLSVALKGLMGRKVRALLTGLAVIIGVAMITGTYVLTDTIAKSFDAITQSSLTGSDVVVSGKKVVASSEGDPPSISATLIDKIRTVPGVADIGGTISDSTGARIAEKNGKLSGGGGAPTFALGVDGSKPQFNPLRISTGRFAERSDEVVIDVGTASKLGYRVGDKVGIAVRGPVRTFTLTGLVTYGTAKSLGGATIAGFDLAAAQTLLGRTGQVDTISVASKAGTDTKTLLKDISAVVPNTATVRSSAAEAKEQSKNTSAGLGFITNFLLAFAGIALFVGSFVIFNTLSITVAQRTREFATLRTLGASRRQVMRSVLIESFIVGLVSSIIGIAAGLGVAKGLNALFVALGIDLPQTAAVLATRTIVVSLLVGTIVTVIASVIPARRATRVPAISAVREGATLAPTRLGRRGPAIGAISAIAAIGILAYSVLGNLSTSPRLLMIVAGLAALFLAIALLLPAGAGPLARILGAPSARFGGMSGRLGVENAVRSPGRTASTAAALMIGLALMSFVAVLGNGLRQSDRAALKAQIAATHVISAGDSGPGQNLATGTSEAAAVLPGVEIASGIRSDDATAAGKSVVANGVDPATITKVYTFRWTSGSNATAAGLTAQDALVTTDFAVAHRLTVGSSFPLLTPSGQKRTLRVAGTFRPSKFDSLMGDVVITRSAFDAAFPRPADALTLVRTTRATDQATLAAGLKSFPDASVKTTPDYITQRAAGINTLLNLLYVLLALSVVVSLFGMVNTLALSVIERTREIGMMRAVGMGRRQASRMITHEGIITALMGAAIGLPLGVGLAALITRALSAYDIAFQIPVGTLLVFALVSIGLGILAAAAPGRRAARLDILEALRYQ